MGLNTIQTYVPWNWHEENEGNFTFTGDHDLGLFLRTAQKVGLLVLVRSGPYMCGEWEFGGLPAWLLSKDGLVIRTYNDVYISYVEKYFNQLYAVLEPLLYSNGGPIAMVQVENEYGSYGDVSKHPSDKQYLQHLIDLANMHFNQTKSGEKTIIYTTDGGNTGYMTRGSFKGDSVFTTGDGGPSDGSGIFNAMKQFNPTGMSPGINSEDYTGWLTHWGEHMANQSSASFASNMAKLLNNNYGSINMYMGFGGTNFGFMSGANGGGTSVSYHITSYDYASPLSEGGQHGWGSDHTDKYEAYRTAIEAHTNETLPAEPPSPVVKAYGSLSFDEASGSVAIMEESAKAVLVTQTFPSESSVRAMEYYNQNYGFIQYSFATHQYEQTLHDLHNERQGQQQQEGGNINVQILDYARDRAIIFTGTNADTDANASASGSSNAAKTTLTEVATLFRNTGNTASIPLPAAGAGASLNVLVENMGRVNFGHSMTDHKGITEAVLLGGKNLSGTGAVAVTTIPLQYDQVNQLPFGKGSGSGSVPGPRFYKTSLTITGTPADTYLSTRTDATTSNTMPWHKGYIWVNGHNLGRFWEDKGPQHALYVPNVFLKTGDNEIIVLELQPTLGSTNITLQSTASSDFDNTTPPSPAPGTPCAKTPTAGHVIELGACDSSRNEAQLFVFKPLGGTQLGGQVALMMTTSTSTSSPSSGSTHTRDGDATTATATGLCLSFGPGKDATFGFALAQMEPCDLNDVKQIHEWVNDTAKGAEGMYTLHNVKSKQCLDVSNHFTAEGSPVGWYSCQTGGLTTNEAFSRVETPLHGEHIIGKESGKCLSAC
jgi:hypothetical protein